jgi:hypothetical protein
MRRVLPIAALTMISTAGNVALAQRDLQGPLLVPPSPQERVDRSSNAFGPSPSRAGISSQRYSGSFNGPPASPYYLGGRNYYPDSDRNARPRVPNVAAPQVDTAPIRDPQIAQIAEWYQQFLGRPMAAVERNNWEIYLHRDTGSLDKVLVQMLGGDEFYKQSGGNFDSWLRSVAQVTGIRMSPLEAAQWRDQARGTDRLTFGRQFLIAEGVIGGPGLVTLPPFNRRNDGLGHDHHHHDGDVFGGGYSTVGGSYYGSGYGSNRTPFDRIVPFSGAPRQYGSGYQIPQYLADDSAVHAHEHSVGYGPRGGNSPQELIASWYQTYFGREIAPGEMNKWLSDLNKGMSIDEVYASVLAAPEWYNRAGGNPSSWIGSTLAALGQSNDGNAVNYWLDRFRRNDGDRFDTALEMVRGRADRDGDDRRRRDRRFDNDD